MTLHFENYARIVRAGKAFAPGIDRDKFVYAMAAVMSAHVKPEQLTKLLDQVMGDMTTIRGYSNEKTSAAAFANGG